MHPKCVDRNEVERAQIREAIALRDKWLYHREAPEYVNAAPPRQTDYTTFISPPFDPFDPDLPPDMPFVCHWDRGVMTVYESSQALMHRKPLVQVRLPHLQSTKNRPPHFKQSCP